jgi:hypothetical protein
MPVPEQSKLASVTRSLTASMSFLRRDPWVMRAYNTKEAYEIKHRGWGDTCREVGTSSMVLSFEFWRAINDKLYRALLLARASLISNFSHGGPAAAAR